VSEANEPGKGLGLGHLADGSTGLENRDIIFGRKSPQKRDLAKRLRTDMTPAEARLWGRLRRSQLGGAHFRRQQIIDGFVADFYCHSAGLIVEVDGGIHEEQAEYDRTRDAVISARGLSVVRFTNDQVLSEIEGVLAEIAKIVQAS